MSSLYLSPRLFAVLGWLAVTFVLGHFFPILVRVGDVALVALAGIVACEALVLWRGRLHVTREVAPRLSNGDENPVLLRVANSYRVPVRVEVRDEVPPEFQRRDLRLPVRVGPRESDEISYVLRPVRRGVYRFGHVVAFATVGLGLVQRRFRGGEAEEVAVYPAFHQLRSLDLVLRTDRLDALGIRPVRRRGAATSFEHVREYARGDEVRHVNWRATARRGHLMVNQYEDERAQPVVCLLDTARTMQMPFDGLTLLDHAINATVMLSGVALAKGDMPGAALFGKQPGAFVMPDRRRGQMERMLQALYRATPETGESDLGRMAVEVDRRLPRRSALVLFSNFASHAGLSRMLPALRRLSARHLVVVVLFDNPLLRALGETVPTNLEAAYNLAVARRMRAERLLLQTELQRAGLRVLHVPPQALTPSLVGEYLAIKTEGVL